MLAFMFTMWTYCILPNMQGHTEFPSWALSPPPFIPDTAVFPRLLSFPCFTSFSPSFFSSSEDSQVVSPSCVSSCLVLWCACSCQYLCLLWIACFSLWLDTNVAHKLLSTLMWTSVGEPYKVIKGNQITYYKFIICVTSSVKKTN